jgi:hypothetical protein
MLRADLLDAMDYMMQTVRKNCFWWCSSVVYWRFIAVATGNSGRRMAYAEKLLQRKILFHSHVVQQHPPYTLNCQRFSSN